MEVVVKDPAKRMVHVRWECDGMFVAQKRKKGSLVLSIKKMRQFNAGTYICIIKHSKGKTISPEFEVIVDDRPPTPPPKAGLKRSAPSWKARLTTAPRRAMTAGCTLGSMLSSEARPGRSTAAASRKPRWSSTRHRKTHSSAAPCLKGSHRVQRSHQACMQHRVLQR